jgi:hypothetical protein
MCGHHSYVHHENGRSKYHDKGGECGCNGAGPIWAKFSKNYFFTAGTFVFRSAISESSCAIVSVTFARLSSSVVFRP